MSAKAVTQPLWQIAYSIVSYSSSSCEVWFIRPECCGPPLNALLGSEQQRRLPLVQPRHAVKLCHGICELLHVPLLLCICQVLYRVQILLNIQACMYAMHARWARAHID